LKNVIQGSWSSIAAKPPLYLANHCLVIAAPLGRLENQNRKTSSKTSFVDISVPSPVDSEKHSD
jgi:hypothetical protein